MDSKKVVSKFIKPNMVPMIIFLVIPITTIFALIVFFAVTLPSLKRAKKCIAALEAKGELDKAAAELIAPNNKKYIKEKAVFTENYMFCENTGFALSYSDIIWAYKHRQTNTVFLIPIKVTDSLYIAANGIKPIPAAHMGKDKNDEIKASILEIYSHNNECLVGYTSESIAKYKEIKKRK